MDQTQTLVKNFRSGRSDYLDVLRCVAIVSVVVFHVATRFDWSSLDPVASFFRRFGFLGVDIFFPLSGFLITRYLLKSTLPHFGKVFFMRRFFRIIPLYFVATTIYLILNDFIGNNIKDQIWIVYLLLTGWFIFFEGTKDAVPFTITWSISVEEFAYIIFGIYAILFRPSLDRFLIALCVFSIGLRLYLNVYSQPEIYHFPLARLDSIALGGLTAYICLQGKSYIQYYILASVTLFILTFWNTILWETSKYIVISLITCTFIVISDLRLTGKTTNAVVAASASIGFYSYFIYLFHLFNIDFIMLMLEYFSINAIPLFWPICALSLLLTYTQAWISFRVFEGPIMQFGRQLEPSTRMAR